MPTYAEASNASRVATGRAAADPTNADLQADSEKKAAIFESVFKGQSLRGMLLNAYAFWELGQIASISALAALVGALLPIELPVELSVNNFTSLQQPVIEYGGCLGTPL